MKRRRLDGFSTIIVTVMVLMLSSGILGALAGMRFSPMLLEAITQLEAK